MSDNTMTYSGMSRGSTGFSSPLAERPKPQRVLLRASPDGRTAPDRHHWDERFADHPMLYGFIPDSWSDSEKGQQLRLWRERVEQEKRDRKSHEERIARQAALLAATPPPPPTVEERLASLEARLARLEAPTSLRTRTAPRRHVTGDRTPPEAA